MHKLKLLFVFLLAGVCASQAVTYYVAVDGDDTRTGLDWANALATIGNAVSKANRGTGGDTVLVSNGTYTLTSYIFITNGMTVRSVNGRDFTFLNGNYPNTTNRCFYIDYSSTSAVIDGFTMTNGYAFDNHGSAIYMKNGGLIRNCVISSNYADGRGSVYMTGTCIVENCVIVSNTSGAKYFGAGVHFDGPGGVLRDSTVGWNIGNYGSIMAYSGGSCLISNCDIIGNISTSYGGGVTLYTSNNLIVDCRIKNNRAGNRGGGIYMSKTGNTVKDCSIISNTTGYAGGGGIYVGDGDNNVIQNCEIIGNTATDSGGGGGGVCFSTGTHWLRNCLIKGNQSMLQHGGAIYVVAANSNSTCTVQNCTIVNNEAPNRKGGGAYSFGGQLYLENCILTSNTSGDATYPEWYNIGGAISFTNCLVWSAQTTELSGSGNITNQPPMFVNESAGQYQLTDGSPCINTGINQDWMSTAVDLDKRSRLDRFSKLVDRGCYEYPPKGSMFSCY